MLSENSVIVKGKDLKALFHLSSGVLVFKDNKLTYVAFEDPVKLTLPNLNQRAKEPVVFISYDFYKIRVLNDDEDYLLVFKCGVLEIWDKDHQNIQLAIIGITV